MMFRGSAMNLCRDRRFFGSGGETRTHNLRINSPMLCQLSYPGRNVGTDAGAC